MIVQITHSLIKKLSLGWFMVVAINQQLYSVKVERPSLERIQQKIDSYSRIENSKRWLKRLAIGLGAAVACGYTYYSLNQKDAAKASRVYSDDEAKNMQRALDEKKLNRIIEKEQENKLVHAIAKDFRIVLIPTIVYSIFRWIETSSVKIAADFVKSCNIISLPSIDSSINEIESNVNLLNISINFLKLKSITAVDLNFYKNQLIQSFKGLVLALENFVAIMLSKSANPEFRAWILDFKNSLWSATFSLGSKIDSGIEDINLVWLNELDFFAKELQNVVVQVCQTYEAKNHVHKK